MSWEHNPDKLKASLATDRVLRADVLVKHPISTKHRRAVKSILIELHGMHCWLCNLGIVGEEPTLDHVVPRSKFGRNAIANLRLAHFICNQRRGNGPIPELLLTKAMRLANYPTIPSS